MSGKALIFDIKRFAVHDGDGIRTTVFFKGCPLSCIWCHNPEGISHVCEIGFYAHKCKNCAECTTVCSSNAHIMQTNVHLFDKNSCTACGNCEDVCLGDAIKLHGRRMSVEELLPMLLEDVAFYETSGGGVTLSGGECLVQADFCRELLSALKERGIRTAVDTCGFVPKSSITKVLPYTDVFLYDLKAYDEAVHKKCTGQSNDLILENLKYLNEQGKKIEIRIPYVPDCNDGEIPKLAEFISGLKSVTRVKILPYHNYASGKYASLGMKCTLPERLPTDEEITAAKEAMHSYGIVCE